MACVGKGTFGTVMLAHHKYTGDKFAVKIIDKKVIKETFTANGQVFAELEIMQEISGSCPNVMNLVESFEDDNFYFCVTRFMAGGDLNKYITEQ